MDGCDHCIQLSAYREEIEIEVERSHIDPIATHRVGLVQTRILVGFCIEKHAGNLMGNRGGLSRLVFHMRIDLVVACDLTMQVESPRLPL